MAPVGKDPWRGFGDDPMKTQTVPPVGRKFDGKAAAGKLRQLYGGGLEGDRWILTPRRTMNTQVPLVVVIELRTARWHGRTPVISGENRSRRRPQAMAAIDSRL